MPETNPLLTAFDKLSGSSFSSSPSQTQPNNSQTDSNKQSTLNEQAIKNAATITTPSVKLQENKATTAQSQSPQDVKTDSTSKLAAIQDAKKSITENMKGAAPKADNAATMPGGVSPGKILTSTLTGIGTGAIANMILPGSGPVVTGAMTGYDALKGMGSLSSMTQNKDSAPLYTSNKNGAKTESSFKPSSGPSHSMDGRMQTGNAAQATTNQFNKAMSTGPGFGSADKMSLTSSDVEITSASLNGIEKLTGMKPEAFMAQLDQMEEDYKLSLNMYEHRADKGLATTADNLSRAFESGMSADDIHKSIRTQTLDARTI